jgi:RNA polymerase sigma factor (sigma-70 family)
VTGDSHREGAMTKSKEDPGKQSRNASQPPTETESTFRLLDRCKSGDREALERLYARYLPRLQRWASGRLPRWARDLADTQDLVQETLLQTFNKMGTFEPQHEGAFQAYLRQAVMNRIRDEIRRVGRKPGQARLEDEHVDQGPSPLEKTIGLEAIERYEQALARLRPEEREAIIARVEMGYSFEELAGVLGKPTPDAARKAAQRALLRLAEEMGRAQR